MSADDRWSREETYSFQSSTPYSQATAAYPAPAGQWDSNVLSNGASPVQSSRRAHLRVSRVNPWSVTKFSFVVSLVCFIVLFVAVAILYGVLAVIGVFDAVGSMMSVLTGAGEGLFSPTRVLGYAALVGGVNVVLITLLLTLGAYVYNLVAEMVGGIEVTLSEGE